MADEDITFSVTGGTSISTPIDTSLTNSGMAADAKAVGDKITVLSNSISTLSSTLSENVASLQEEIGSAASAQDVYDEETARKAADQDLQTQIDTLTGSSDSSSTSIASMIATAIDAAKSSIMEAAFPVGSLYFLGVEGNPADLLGFGTWTQIKGRFLYATPDNGTIGTTGGAEAYSHTHGTTYSAGYGSTEMCTLTVNQIPAHTHGTRYIKGWFGMGTESYVYASKATGTGSAFDAGELPNTTLIPSDVEGVCKTITKSYWIKPYRSKSNQKFSVYNTSNNAVKIDASHEHDSVGGGNGHRHNIKDASTSAMPPYITVNVWRRTA